MAYGSTLTAEEDGSRARKSRGAFFTPPELARYLAEFAVRRPTDTVLEPSCGEGEFIEAAFRRLTGLGLDAVSASDLIVGCELHEATARAASSRLASEGIYPKIICGDFFEQEPTCSFDAVLGNPPYIRFQEFTGAERAKAMEDALKAGVNVGAQSSAWAPFVVHASLFLRDGGRLAFVLPAELLSTNYAAPIRRYLLDHFREVRVVLFETPVFPEVQEEVVLLLADGFRKGGTGHILLSQIHSTDELALASGRAVPVSGGQRWPVGEEGRAAENLLDGLVSDEFCTLGEWADVRLGAVTGANGFFAVSLDDARRFGMHEGVDLVRVSPPGSRHLRRVSFSSEDWFDLRERGKRTYLFYPEDELSDAALDYIHLGERNGVSTSYKCRVRSPWWRVPGIRVADAFFTYMNGTGPNICSNDAGVVHLNSVHGVYFLDDIRSVGKAMLPLLSLSSITQLSAEVYGRSYGGGILKLEPREAVRLVVPTPDVARQLEVSLKEVRQEIETLLVSGQRLVATRKIDRILMEAGLLSGDEIREGAALLESLSGRRRSRSRSKVRDTSR